MKKITYKKVIELLFGITFWLFVCLLAGLAEKISNI